MIDKVKNILIKIPQHQLYLIMMGIYIILWVPYLNSSDTNLTTFLTGVAGGAFHYDKAQNIALQSIVSSYGIIPILIIWAGIRRCNISLIILFLISFYLLLDVWTYNIDHLQHDLYYFNNGYQWTTVSDATHILLEIILILTIWLIFAQRIILKNFVNYNNKLEDKNNNTKTTLIFLGIMGIITCIMQTYVICKDTSWLMLTLEEVLMGIPSVLILSLITWAGLKRWQPIINLLVILSPFFIITGLVGTGMVKAAVSIPGLINISSNHVILRVKILGFLYIILAILSWTAWLIKLNNGISYRI